MNHLQLLMGVSVVVLCGCGTTESETATVAGSSVCCERPTFSIFFHPASLDEREEPDVTIEENSNVGPIRVEIDGSEQSVNRSQRYQRLKRKILASTEWAEGKTEGFFGHWMGPPRDILFVRADGYELNLQGDKVPAGWRQEILDLASEYQ